MTKWDALGMLAGGLGLGLWTGFVLGILHAKEILRRKGVAGVDLY